MMNNDEYAAQKDTQRHTHITHTKLSSITLYLDVLLIKRQANALAFTYLTCKNTCEGFP